jgi:aspartate carbamoyltransferase regulatory subunit
MKEFKVMPIKDGTVIDHITPGMALKVLKILGITGSGDAIVSVAMNVPSAKCKSKDIVKIEDRELEHEELNKIALIAPRATFNIIRDFSVGKKHTVEIPDTVEGIVKCENPNCISNKKEPIIPKCIVKSKMPVELKCYYCDRDITDIISNII